MDVQDDDSADELPQLDDDAVSEITRRLTANLHGTIRDVVREQLQTQSGAAGEDPIRETGIDSGDGSDIVIGSDVDVAEDPTDASDVSAPFDTDGDIYGGTDAEVDDGVAAELSESEIEPVIGSTDATVTTDLRPTTVPTSEPLELSLIHI